MWFCLMTRRLHTTPVRTMLAPTGVIRLAPSKLLPGKIPGFNFQLTTFFIFESQFGQFNLGRISLKKWVATLISSFFLCMGGQNSMRSLAVSSKLPVFKIHDDVPSKCCHPARMVPGIPFSSYLQPHPRIPTKAGV